MGLKRYFEMRAVATFYQLMFVIIMVVAYLIYTNFIQRDSPPKSKDNIEAEQPINQ